ncbi:phage major capsid protein [Mesorhizobium sp. CAU 1741]|uniref:phage major capsid protein n=1 Tax=Mesorhizobium sp. CAU 1741 TaxID=3140366 RepID=UPI00325AC94E
MSKHTVRAVSGLLGGVAFPVFMMANPADRITALESQRTELMDSIEALLASAPEDDDLTDEQYDEIDEKRGEVEKIDARIETMKALLPQGAGRKSKPEPSNGAGGGEGGTQRRVPAAVRDNNRHNFSNLGEFAQGVRLQAGGNGEHESVKKLLNAATTYGNEGTGADGGFMVPPEFSRQLWQKVEAEENLMNRCTVLTPSGNSMSIPKDETSPWGTGGVRVYWEAEGAQATASKAALELSTMRLHKLFALVPASEELLEDATGYESYLQAIVPGRMSARINTAIVRGTGVGQPLGFLRAPSLISVPKETSQPADTVWMKNIEKMWSRMYAPWRRNAIWLINQDIEPSLGGMAFQATGAASDLPGTSAVPAYMPANGLSASPYATLKGRPVVPVEAASAVGDQGDISLVDFNQYWVLRKAAGLRTDTSMHLYFDQALTAFRFIFRINGQPMWSTAVDRENGSNTLSWCVTLDAR